MKRMPMSCLILVAVSLFCLAGCLRTESEQPTATDTTSSRRDDSKEATTITPEERKASRTTVSTPLETRLVSEKIAASPGLSQDVTASSGLLKRQDRKQLPVEHQLLRETLDDLESLISSKTTVDDD